MAMNGQARSSKISEAIKDLAHELCQSCVQDDAVKVAKLADQLMSAILANAS